MVRSSGYVTSPSGLAVPNNTGKGGTIKHGFKTDIGADVRRIGHRSVHRIYLRYHHPGRRSGRLLP